jgi:multidrug efflux pump subunit AcrA (membrane-fusion protein)
VRLTTDRRQDIFIVPSSAVLGKGLKRFCFVRVGKDQVAIRDVVAGLSNEQSVEIRGGLKESDEVIADLRTVLGKLAPK